MRRIEPGGSAAPQAWLRRFRHAETVTLVVCCLCVVNALSTQATAQSREQVEGRRGVAGLPSDPAIRSGKLPNGLRYALRHNARPARRVELRLMVAVGSLMESHDQRGFAHLVEHMAVGSVGRVGRDGLVAYLESIGVRFGTDVNAQTSHHETLYQLTVPTDTPNGLRNALSILGEWASHIAFDSATLDVQRKIVIEEWRNRLASADRLADRRDSAIHAGHGHSGGSPIGTRESIESATPARLERFYRSWYRPERMTVIVVGDIDVHETERLVTELFGGAEGRPLHLASSLPSHQPTSPAVVVSVDSQAALAGIELLHREPVHAVVSRAAFRVELSERIVSMLLEQRLQDATMDAGLAIPSIAVSVGNRTREAGYRGISLRLAGADLEEGLALVAAEIARAARYGFPDAEVRDAGRRIVRKLERDSAAGAMPSSLLATALTHALSSGRALMSVEQELALTRDMLPSIKSRVIMEAARRWRSDENRIVLVTVPSGDAHLRSATRVGALLDADGPPRVTRVPKRPPPPLFATLPAPGRVVAEWRHDDTGIEEWVLSNGARVLLKPTTLAGGDLLFHGYRPGGWDRVEAPETMSARFAGELISSSGVGGLSRHDLDRVLASQTARVAISINQFTDEIHGAATASEADLLFQLVHLRMASPRVDGASFLQWRNTARDRLTGAQRQPSTALEHALALEPWRPTPPWPDMLDAVDPEEVLRFFQDRFGDASAFTFFLVGAFTSDSIRPLVERYLASLPTLPSKAPDAPGRMAQGGRVSIVAHALEYPMAMTYLRFSGALGSASDQTYMLHTVADLMRARANRRLRHELGGTYGVDVRVQVARSNAHFYAIELQFTSSPERADALCRELTGLIEELQANGPSAVELRNVAQLQRRVAETDLADNHFWLAALKESHMLGVPIGGQPFASSHHVGTMTIETLRDAARSLFDWSNHVHVRLLPQPPADHHDRAPAGR